MMIAEIAGDEPGEAQATPLWALSFLLSAQCIDVGFQLHTPQRPSPSLGSDGALDLPLPETMDRSGSLFA